MKVLNLLYEKTKKPEIATFIDQNQIARYRDRALLQVFASSAEESEIEELLSFLKGLLPYTPILGATCFGAILDGKVIEQGIVLSFCLFEDTTVKTELLPSTSNAYQMGVEMANRLIRAETQVIITYTDLLSFNRTDYLRGLASQKKEVTVAGHPAFDYSSMAFTQAGVVKEGAVAAALSGKTIQAINGYELNWVPIGRIMQVTEAEGSHLIEIEGRPAAEVFRRYLGPSVLEGPIGIRATFPIIVHRNGIQVARLAFDTLASGAIVCLGDIQKGDQIQFSYGHLDTILDKNEPLVHAFEKEEIEGLFIFSCAARRVFMGQAAEYESLPFGKIFRAAVFFSYGEFYDIGRHIEALTNTFTYLALSEKQNGKLQKKTLCAGFQPYSIGGGFKRQNCAFRSYPSYQNFYQRISRKKRGTFQRLRRARNAFRANKRAKIGAGKAKSAN